MVVHWKWCLRSRKCSLLVIIASLLAIGYYVSTDVLYDQESTKSLEHSVAGSRHVRKYEERSIAPQQPNSLHRSDIIKYVEAAIEEALKFDKGTGCDVPYLDPFSPEITKFDKEKKLPTCNAEDWVYCELNECRVKESIIYKMTDVKCTYRDLIFDNDFKNHLGDGITLPGHMPYKLKRSDFVDVACHEREKKWAGLLSGLRPVVTKRPPPGRENTFNIMFLAFDSTAKNGFIRRLPRSYKVLTEELEAVVLNRYNIVGDGTPAALYPILTGLTELELPEVRKRISTKRYMDAFPFLWNKLRNDGYRTSYSEDSPFVGTFQYRFTGFRNPPTDHYLRPFFLQYHSNIRKYGSASSYCIGGIPSYFLMMKRTRQFMRLPGKKFIFTFIADISHNDFNYISNAEDDLVQWLRDVKQDGVLDDTLLIVMGDHGPRYADLRNTLQGKLEERLPLMAIVLPKKLREKNPQALENLKNNADVLTTPFDIHNTLLDLVDMYDDRVRIKIKGADLPRSMSLLRKIPSTRSCSEAGIEPHWCTCLKWTTVDRSDPIFISAGRALLDFINTLTRDERGKCVLRTLTDIESVSRRNVHQNLLKFKTAKDKDGYVGAFDSNTKQTKQYYQTKITVGPGVGIYEASMVYDMDQQKFRLTTRDISRTNAYNDEPACVRETRPDLSMYCYCRNT